MFYDVVFYDYAATKFMLLLDTLDSFFNLSLSFYNYSFFLSDFSN